VVSVRFLHLTHEVNQLAPINPDAHATAECFHGRKQVEVDPVHGSGEHYLIWL
jgi:hypothetical protein